MTPPAERILVIRLGALGDVVRTLPALAGLRALYPAAHIAWLVEPAAAGALAAQPGLDEVIVFPRDRLESDLRRLALPGLVAELARVVRGLRSRRFDLVLDFHGIAKSGLLARLTGAPSRIGYARQHAREGAWRLVNHHVIPGSGPISRFARNATLVEAIGGEVGEGESSRMGVSGDAVTRIRSLLGPHPPAVLIHPGSSAHTPYKRYTTAGYAQIARALADAPGVDVRIACGPAEGERALARAIVDAAGGTARLAPATPDVQALAALCRESLLFVGSDSGPLHVASMVGTPVVQLLGPRHPIENEPWSGTAWRRVYLDLACSPCRRGCPTAPCMRDIPPSAVIAAARDLLAARGFASVASRVEPPALAGVAAS